MTSKQAKIEELIARLSKMRKDCLSLTRKTFPKDTNGKFYETYSELHDEALIPFQEYWSKTSLVKHKLKGAKMFGEDVDLDEAEREISLIKFDEETYAIRCRRYVNAINKRPK